MQLRMKLPIIAGVAPFQPGSRVATASDAPALARLLGLAFPDSEWNVERVHRDLLDEPSVVEVRVIDGGTDLSATASARYFDRFPGQGYVHWVGIDPSVGGQGLGQAIVTHVIERFIQDGIPSVILETDDSRLPAITSYLGIGFVPQYPAPDHEDRWSRVFTALGDFRRLRKGAA